MPIICFEKSDFLGSYADSQIHIRVMLQHGSDYQLVEIGLPDDENGFDTWWNRPTANIYERIIRRDQIGGDNAKTFYQLTMKNQFEKDHEVAIIHCASGFYLFNLDDYEDPAYFKATKSKYEAFKTITGFGYYDSYESKLFLFH